MRSGSDEPAPQSSAERRPVVGGPLSALDALDSTAALCVQIERLTAENEQLADEVLRNYEQLSLLFDFSTQIAGVTHVEPMTRLLLDRCAALLRAREVYAQNLHDGWSRYDAVAGTLSPGRPEQAPETVLNEIVGEARARHIVAVRATVEMQIVAGPLEFGETTAVVVALREAAAGEFTSGEMRLLESLLTFGGQLLNNNALHERIRRLSMQAMRALVSAIDKKDNYTCGHSERVGFFARMVGARLGLPPATLDQLEWAGLLHDVGKIGITENVLNKAGRLTDEEFTYIKQHPRMGYEILEPLQNFADVRRGVLHHHENMDGSGYPDGLAGEAIPLFARIIHVVDVFDALSSRRSYRDALSIERAVRVIRQEAGTKLDPKIAAEFLDFLAEFERAEPEKFAALFSAPAQTEPAP